MEACLNAMLVPQPFSWGETLVEALAGVRLLVPGSVRSFLRASLNNLLALSSESREQSNVRGSEAGRQLKGGGSISGGQPSPERDQFLVERAQRGDKDAFRQLVVAYQERLFTVVRGMVRNQEDAQDITQDVFIKAYASLGSFQGQSSFYTWLYRIAVNMTIDYRRRKGRRQESSFDEKIDPDAAEGTELPDARVLSPQRAYLDKELGGKIRQAMESLPEDQRTAIVLRELEGLSYKEIADMMECSQGTVMSRLFYGRKKLQEILKDFLS